MQHATVADGRTVAQLVVDELADRNVGAEPFGSLGIVVGATIGSAAVDLRGLHGPVLMPGVGAGQRWHARTTCGASRALLLPAVVPSVSRRCFAAAPICKSLGGGSPPLDRRLRLPAAAYRPVEPIGRIRSRSRIAAARLDPCRA